MNGAQITRVRSGLDVVRELPAPVERVFLALSDPEELATWWGPPGYPMVRCTLDFRPGGVWHYALRGARAGEEVWARAVYTRIDPPAGLRYLETPSDAAGRITSDRPAADVAIDLAPVADGRDTRLTIRIRHRSPLDRDRAVGLGLPAGLSSALDALELRLQSSTAQKERP